MKTWNVPDSRLPFVNAEVAKVEFRGEPHLVSSIWGGGAGGRLYFWNPETRSHAVRMLPEGIPGAYMLKPGPEGKLYLGCGNGDLVRYNPKTGDFEDLVRADFRSITWGGCVTDRYVVWAFSPGRVAVYDLHEERLAKVFDPADTEEPVAQYGHRVIPTPDGRVLIGMDVPQARLILLDFETMTTQSVTPEALVGKGATHDATFLDDETLAVFAGPLHLLRYPGFDLLDVIPNPAGVSALGARACFVGGDFYALQSGTGSDLYRLDLDAKSWELVAEALCGDEFGTMHAWDDHTVCAVSLTGIAHSYDVRTGGRTELDLEASGPMSVHAFCPVPEEETLLGAPFINQRFWRIDVASGEGRDLGRGAPAAGRSTRSCGMGRPRARCSPATPRRPSRRTTRRMTLAGRRTRGSSGVPTPKGRCGRRRWSTTAGTRGWSRAPSTARTAERWSASIPGPTRSGSGGIWCPIRR